MKSNISVSLDLASIQYLQTQEQSGKGKPSQIINELLLKAAKKPEEKKKGGK